MNNLVAMLDKVLARPIAFHRIFATIGGGATEGLFLSQAYYWSFRTNDPNGWFYKTKDEWESETALNRREQESARKILVRKSVLETKKEGLPCKLFYRINRDHLYQLIAAFVSSKTCGCQFGENVQTSMNELANNLVQNDQQVGTNRQTILYTENTSETTLPPTPQGKKEGERNFGFEINQEVTVQPPATLLSQPEAVQPTSQIVVKVDVAPMRVDPFFNRRRAPKDISWDWLPDGPWRTEEGKLDNGFSTAIAKRWIKEHGGDVHEKKVNVLKHFRNEPTNLPIEWEWYQSTTIHRAANIQTRKVNGMDTTADEQEILKHSAALKELPDEMRVTESKTPNNLVEEVAGYSTKYIEQVECTQQTPVLESVATVTDEIWDKVKAQTHEYETTATAAPEGAENYAAYSITVNRETSDYYRQLDEKNKAALAKKTYAPIKSSEQAKNKITALTNSKSMPSVSPEERQRFKEQENQGRKLAYWNSLLQSGLPSVIADVERQASAQGYEIVDGQVSEVDF